MSLVTIVLVSYQVHALNFRRHLRENADKDSIKESLEAGRKELEKIMSLIFHRYELGTEQGRSFFYSASNMEGKAFDILKWKFATKMVQIGSTPTYNMVFGGSSVTAGHDNFFNQSYPIIFERRMKDVFSKLGIELLVRNIAQGANNCVPFILCNEAMGGANIDFLNWEQSYNCGRDEAIFEAALRNVMWNGPGVIYYSASGSPSSSKCPPSTDAIPYNDDNWSPALAGLQEWKVTDDAVQEQKNIILKFNEGGKSYARFGASSRDYKSVAAMGFNVWEKNSVCERIDPKTNVSQKGCTAADVVSCSMHFMTKEASIFGKEDGRGANWHPPRAMHMLRGEIIVWQISLVLHETINMLIQDLISKDLTTLAAEYQSELKKFEEDNVPHPKRCGTLHCEYRPQCFTNYLPHYSKDHYLRDIIVGEVAWSADSEKYSDWSLKYGFLDAKPSYHSIKDEPSKELHIAVEIKEHDFVWICGNSKESLAKAIFHVDKNVKIVSNEKYEPSAQRELWTKKKYIGQECKEIQELPKGKHVISVSNGGEKALEVSHVVTW